MWNLKKPGLDRKARLQAASWGLQLRAEGAIRLGLGKEKVKAGTPTPSHFARVSNFFCPFSKNQFTGLAWVAGSDRRRLLSAVLTQSPRRAADSSPVPGSDPGCLRDRHLFYGLSYTRRAGQ